MFKPSLHIGTHVCKDLQWQMVIRIFANQSAPCKRRRSIPISGLINGQMYIYVAIGELYLGATLLSQVSCRLPSHSFTVFTLYTRHRTLSTSQLVLMGTESSGGKDPVLSYFIGSNFYKDTVLLNIDIIYNLQ